eukprot:EG_transcript_24173
MKKTFRKRKLEEEDAKEEEGDALEVDIMRQVAEAKKRQKLRSKQVLEAGKAQGKKPQEKPEEEEKYGLQENDTFSKQFKESSTPWSGIEHDDKMREYIERKLLEHRGSSSVLPNGTEDEVAQPKTIDELALEGHGHEDVVYLPHTFNSSWLVLSHFHYVFRDFFLTRWLCIFFFFIPFLIPSNSL